MRWPPCLIGVAIAAFAGSAIAALHARSNTDGYAGSSSCQTCHESEYAAWRRTLHVQMTKPIAEATVVGDFTPGTHFEQNGRAYGMETHDGRYFISVSHNGRPAEKFEVHYTLGARRFQGYLSKLADGRIYVLPAFWHNEAKRWVDWKEITPIPNDPDHDLRQIWNITCVNCHATNLAKQFDAATKTYATTWTEMGIGCEACHGPGAAHNASPAAAKLFAPRDAAPRQVFDTCGYCHGNKNNAFFGFKPGDRYEDYAQPFLVSQPIPDNDPQGDFWPDGRPSRFNRPQALMQTGCFQQGQATCTSCHRAHGTNAHLLKMPVETPSGAHTRQSDALCTQCHGAERAGGAGGPGRAGEAVPAATGYGNAAVAPRAIPDLTAHTHHAADSPGSRCIDCHMSDVNWRLITRRRDHTFQPPVPEMTSRFGAPNACTACHEDKSPEWAASIMDTWYGNGDRRRAAVAMADMLYRAGAGDTAVLPDVARLAVDRSRGAPIRASAAEFVGQLLTRKVTAEAAKSAEKKDLFIGSAGSASSAVALTNALIGAAADPEPMVRINAVRALSLVDDARVVPVLAAHLTDPARLVRTAVAEGLLNRGVASLPGAPGQALGRAQDDWAESLRTFNDVASDHATLGRLEAARGRREQAIGELRTAIHLDPRDARPYIYLGVLSAEAGRYDEALRFLKTAKNLAPDYQNLDRLIEATQKRLTPR